MASNLRNQHHGQGRALAVAELSRYIDDLTSFSCLFCAQRPSQRVNTHGKNQTRKNHRNGIKKAQDHRFKSTKGVSLIHFCVASLELSHLVTSLFT